MNLIAALVAVALTSTPLYADTWKVIGTNEQGTTSALYCAAEEGTSSPLFCQDAQNHNPSTVTGRKWHSAKTRYGWEYQSTPTVATCVPDDTHPERFKTLKCTIT